MGAISWANVCGKVLVRFGPEGWNWIEHGMEHLPENARHGLPVPPPSPVRARPVVQRAIAPSRALPSTLVGSSRKPILSSLERKPTLPGNKSNGVKR